jgi:hypothetical protein
MRGRGGGWEAGSEGVSEGENVEASGWERGRERVLPADNARTAIPASQRELRRVSPPSPLHIIYPIIQIASYLSPPLRIPPSRQS